MQTGEAATTSGERRVSPALTPKCCLFLSCVTPAQGARLELGGGAALWPGDERLSHSVSAPGRGDYLEGLDEGPQQGPDALPTAQQLDQAHDPEEAEEGDGDAGVLLCGLESIGNRSGS